MKLRNIFLAGLAGLSLVSCSDYLDVDAPSKIFPNDVYESKREADRALNGVYAAMLSGDTYGKTFLKELTFNTDVDFATSSNRYFTSTGYKRYECDPDGNTIKKVWDALYIGIERANMLISGLENSSIYDEDDTEFMQMLGEAKVLRAIFYHDLVWYFGDVPYTRVPSFDNTSTIYDVADRTKILDDMINDLIEAAPYMRLTSDTGWNDGVERISKEMAWAMIARLAMTAGGYSLRPDGGGAYGSMQRPDNYLYFYEIARDYAAKVMNESQHSLDDDYYEVFVRECNFDATVTNDDVIFEIPFARESTGHVGYIHGPKMDNTSGATVHQWGKADSSSQLNALYWYFFDDKDKRRGFVNQLFGYNIQGEAEYNNSRTVYNGKWSKLWNNGGLGAATEENTGINFPYMRYADVLLMYAEAVNEINNGPTEEAKKALETVRARAFRGVADAGDKISRPELYGSKESFLKAVLDERKFEFAGENMRWRDLVRNNLLSENVYWSYMRYFNNATGSDEEALNEYDGIEWADRFVTTVKYHNNYNRFGSELTSDQDGYLNVWEFPQQSPNMNIVWVINRFRRMETADDRTNYVDSEGVLHTPGTAYTTNWEDSNTGNPVNHILYCMRGYLNCDEDRGIIEINDNGNYMTAPSPSSHPTWRTLPVVRYILPYPRAIVTRSMGKYTNKYGYN